MGKVNIPFRGEKPPDRKYLAELEFLQKTIKPGHQAVDAGANIGSVAKTLAKVEPKAIVYKKVINPPGYRVPLSDVTTQAVLDYYEAQYQHCRTYFDMVLMKNQEEI